MQTDLKANIDEKSKDEPQGIPATVGMNAPTFILPGMGAPMRTLILQDTDNLTVRPSELKVSSEESGFQARTIILAESGKEVVPPLETNGLDDKTNMLQNLPENSNAFGMNAKTVILDEHSEDEGGQKTLVLVSSPYLKPVEPALQVSSSSGSYQLNSGVKPYRKSQSKSLVPSPAKDSEVSQNVQNLKKLQSLPGSQNTPGIRKRSDWFSLPSVGDVFGQYKIVRELGRGGFGAVYHVHNLEIGRDEALKLILPSARSEFMDIEKRFIREINIAARLEHPNIVRLYSNGNFGQGILWMTMELIRGERLDKKIQAQGAMSFEKAKHFMLQFLSALAEAHDREIVHRDLKPANIMIMQKKGYTDLVKILDFGLSKAIGPSDDNNPLQNLTLDSRQVYGTPQYMAPEQLNRGMIGPWTDVYSAGLIFYEILTGVPCYQGKNIIDIIRKQREQTIDFPENLKNTKAAAVIRKACDKLAIQRYQNASEFYDAVLNLTGLTSIEAENTTQTPTESRKVSAGASGYPIFRLVCLFLLVVILVLMMFR